jgi:hypothetical protein
MNQSPRHYPFSDEPFLDHPYSEIFPLISSIEIERIAQSIDVHGQLSPLVLYQNKILDGRIRYRAITLINQQRTKQKKPLIALKYGRFMYGESGDHIDQMALEFVKNANLYRRNLTDHQIALSLDAIAQKERKLCLAQEKLCS